VCTGCVNSKYNFSGLDSSQYLKSPIQSINQEEKQFIHKKYLDTYLRGYDVGFDSGYDSGYNAGYFRGLTMAKTESPLEKKYNYNYDNKSVNSNDDEDDKKEESVNYEGLNEDNNGLYTPKLKTKTKNTTGTTDLKVNTEKTEKSQNNNPLLIIRKINTKDKGVGSAGSAGSIGGLGSMLNNLFGTVEEEKTTGINYLEDSDDENDNLVSVSDIKCNDDFKNNKKKEFDNINIISIKDIIKKENIESIDDLIILANYYEEKVKPNESNLEQIKDKDNEKEFFEDESFSYTNNEITYSIKDGIVKNETSGKISGDQDEEYKMIERIMDNLGIDVRSATKIVINKGNKKIEPTQKLDITNNSVNQDENKISLYKLNEDYYTINLQKIYKMRGNLIKLKKMIGLDNIKSEIIDMILYYLMEFEKQNNNMLHMTLEGSPGCGKTKLAKIISKLLGAMGVVDNDKVVYARRTDMIGQYLGQTTAKTQQVINSALGGVLFIDEAYSLGNSKKDIYSKECLDILNQNLSDNKKKLVCIIAGYPEELEKYFFSSNPGLTRRFPFRFKIKNYTHQELLSIFVNKINRLDWKFEPNVKLEKFFENNLTDFKYFGGDIDTYIQDIKYTHSRRVVCSHPGEFKIITKKDMDIAFDKFKNRRKSTDSDSWKNMFV
jgi:hypothetical protein